MTQLDQALTVLRADAEDSDAQSSFYDLFLNSSFWVPILSAEQAREMAPEAAESGEVLPLVVEAEGKDFLMLFDTPERLQAWTKEDIPCVEVPGHLLAATTFPPLHWALNVGTEYSKSFHPEEIAWLREVVKQCEAAAEQEATERN